MDKTTELCLGSFLTHDILIKDITSTEGRSDIFYGADYENWSDLRLGCDICNECSIGGLKINYGVLKQESGGDYFLLNDVLIVDDLENDTEYNMAVYWECTDTTYFPDLFRLYRQFDKIRDEEPTHYTNIQYCDNRPNFKRFALEYKTVSVGGTFLEWPPGEESTSYDEFVSKKSKPDYVKVCGRCRTYLQIFKPDIVLKQTCPLKYFWHLFYELFSPAFIFKNIEDKNYIETEVFKGES
jgi:hypothetical protein